MKTFRITGPLVLLAVLAGGFVIAQEPEKKRDQPPDPAAAFQATFQKMSADRLKEPA